uniref:Serologically defined colon cancer antigen 8 n=1 Tax=Lygus hesperus TaxID=30085 RepID=A0A146L8Z3_LYGHE
MIRAKKYKSRKVPKVDLFRKRGSDYSDFAYREAVTKLKYLLAESYTPVTVHKFSSTGSTYKPTYTLANPYENSSINESSYIPPLKMTTLTPPKRPDITFDVAPEYSTYLRKQEDYIQQLEKEGRTCREELARLLSKVRQVIDENDRLKNESKLNGSGIETEEESEIEEKEKRVRCKHTCSAPNIVYESRISELEAQLTQARLELRKAQDEAFLAKTKSYESSTPDTNKQIEALQRERDELNATISNLQMLVNQLRDKEASATLKVKRSLDVVDQAHFDKNQMEMEIRRLKSDLERMNDKQREIMQESARRVSEAERRYTLQIERLNGDLAAQWDTANRLNLELDRARRTESELRREISQRNAVIDELKKELSMKTSNLQTEALTAGAEKESLESELSAQKLAVERAERAGRQESARLQAEVTSLRQRLDRADSDLLHSRKENLRLTENISTLEKEMELAKLSKDSSTSKEPKRSDELTNMIKEMDSKHD